MNQVKYFKGCLPQILHGPFLNALPNTRHGIISDIQLISLVYT